MLSLFASAALAGPIGVGVKGGIPMTDFFEVVNSGSAFRYDAVTRRYTVGPYFELRLPFGLGVEVDILYKRVGYESQLSQPAGVTVSSTKGASWEFPLLAKYEFPGALVRPYIAGGLNFNRFSGLTDVAGITRSADSRTGYVAGMGLEISVPVIRICPEFRYTRWGSDPITGSAASSTMNINRNQAEILVGIAF